MLNTYSLLTDLATSKRPLSSGGKNSAPDNSTTPKGLILISLEIDAAAATGTAVVDEQLQPFLLLSAQGALVASQILIELPIHNPSPLFPQPALMFAVKPLGKHGGSPAGAEVGWWMAKRLAGGGAVETAVEQALMRGLATA